MIYIIIICIQFLINHEPPQNVVVEKEINRHKVYTQKVSQNKAIVTSINQITAPQVNKYYVKYIYQYLLS